MKCPHCNRSVSLLAPSVNRIRRPKTCPHCGASVRPNFPHKKALLLTLGVVMLLMLTAPALSPLHGHLVLMAGSAVLVGAGILALTEMELLSGEPLDRHQS